MEHLAEAPAATKSESALSPPAHRVTINAPDEPLAADEPRPGLTYTLSDPPALESFSSPMRQHRRTPSSHREIKETLDARVEFTSDEVDGRTYHRINQYCIMDEIGRGSYGAVHLATDQFGNEFAVKEFSKTRLRKRAQSQILRQGPQSQPRRATGKTTTNDGPLSPQLGGLRISEQKDALFLIREEIAIMKKLNHPNLVQLIEVLDDPEEDSLYMVLEMCKKGVVMKVGLEEQVDPYSEEICRCWFRDLILAIEYLHSQGVIHRDIKPDNLLLSEDEVLKVVDFGVSEMFELCGKHDVVSGTAADIWSMGISLFCLKFGRIPFYRDGMLEIYEAIKTEAPRIPEGESPAFVDLLHKILDKNPETRIKMPELREHAWVTKDGTDPLLSEKENCAHVIEPPNELELNRAFTRKMNHLLCVMKAIHRFKALLASIRIKQGGSSTSVNSTRSGDFDIQTHLNQRRDFLGTDDDGNGDKGHARDVSEQEPLFLGIGTGSRDDFAKDKATPDVVSDSPTAVDFNVYDRAYEDAINQQMKSDSGRKPTLYLTRFVKDQEHFKKLGNIIEGFKPVLKEAIRDSSHQLQSHLSSSGNGGKLAQLVSKMGISTENLKSDESKAKE